MKKKLIQTAFLMITFTLLFTSCKKDEEDNTLPPLSDRAVYVVNEGSFGNGNASITMINLTNGQIFPDAFQSANGFPLGDLAQSMTVSGDRGYIVVNVSKKVEVVNAVTMQSIGTITGFDGPRYLVVNGNKAYVSDWFANRVAVVDLSTNTITKSITTGEGPEQMIIAGSRLFVTNVGGWGSDSTVTVINLNADTVEATLNVGVNPNSIQLDASGKLWVLCGGSIGPDFTGGTADDIAGSLIKINPTTLATELTLGMNSADHPSKLQVNGTKTTLYYLLGSDGYNGGIATISSSSTTLPAAVGINRSFYGLGVDPVTGMIYGGYSPGFTQSGYVFRYQSSLSLMDSLAVGIGPNGFCFR